ncbi:MAG: 16S rRNA (uracil(1498)-N(3))-methyltransferase [Bacteroidetes bacterium]|jgi:16S rRNA (uracil1498-N3)-methyltransferase|nr:16S rRNA (uracil(1498)-N(3))-methyltransferase [Bacteroidota bacterium]
MHHFYSQNITNAVVELSEEESRHCTIVMRLSVGDEILVFDGVGKKLKCRITEAKKHVVAEVIEVEEEESSAKMALTLAVSPTKSADRMEWMVEKLVEIGVSHIVFIKTEKGERSRLNEKRLWKKAVSAMKQSGNLWLPKIETEVKFKDFLETDQSSQKFIAHCFDKSKTILDAKATHPSVTICIGPEGDFSESEVSAAEAANFVPLSLGLPRYRTETAAVVAGTLFNHFYVTL